METIIPNNFIEQIKAKRPIVQQNINKQREEAFNRDLSAMDYKVKCHFISYPTSMFYTECDEFEHYQDRVTKHYTDLGFICYFDYNPYGKLRINVKIPN